MSCTLGRGQEERAVKASSARAEDKWVRKLLQRKNLGAEKLVQDLVPRGNLNLCFQLSPCSPTHPSPVLQHKLVEGSLLAPSLSAMPLPYALHSLSL